MTTETSAGAAFTLTARALLDLGADDQTKRTVLSAVLDLIEDADWDPADAEETLSEFRHDPVIVSLFYEASIGNELNHWTEPPGFLGYDNKANQWTLTCGDWRHEGCGEVGRREGSAEGHDELVRLWAEHDQKSHDGDGTVQSDALILSGAVA